MKQFTTIKVGYSSGVYGCSNEYFTTIISDGEKMHGFSHYGLYGSEDRVNHALKDKGYKEFYVGNQYGKITGKDKNWCGFMSEYQAIDYINNGFKTEQDLRDEADAIDLKIDEEKTNVKPYVQS